MSATALVKLIAFTQPTADAPRKLRVVSAGFICHDCGRSAQFVIGRWRYCGECAVKIETAEFPEVR